MPSPKTFWRRWDAHHRCSLAVCAEEFDGCTAAHRMYASVLCVPSGAGERIHHAARHPLRKLDQRK